MTLWEDLTTAALLGTERRAVETTALPGALRAAVSSLAPSDPATALLDAAALAVVHRNAGGRGSRGPAGAAESAEPAGQDLAPLPPARAAARLRALVEGRDDELLVEWMDAAASAGYRVPDPVLPDLLERAAGSRWVGARMVAVLGVRGRWLAAQRRRWTTVLGHADTWSARPRPVDATDPGSDADAERAWSAADPPARRALLEHLRRTDPDRGRELLVGTWARDKVEDRERLVRTMGVGLGDRDESFLETALDDRSYRVRARAAGLLARLPGSAYAVRTAARCAEVARVEGRWKKRRLVVRVPGASDAAMVRDGAIEVPAQHVSREARWRLHLVVAAAPLGCWGEITGTDAAGVLDLPMDAGVREDFLSGLVAAVVRQQDRGWAEALLHHGQQTTGITEVLPLLGPERRRRLALEALTTTSTLGWSLERTLLDEQPRPWSPDLVVGAVAWLGTLTDTPATQETLPPAARQKAWLVERETAWRVDLMAHRLPADQLSAVRAITQTHSPGSPWRSRLDEALAVLTTRTEMLEELA